MLVRAPAVLTTLGGWSAPKSAFAGEFVPRAVAVVPCDHGKGWHECIEHENHPFYGSAEQVNVAGSLPSTCESYPPVDEHGASRYRDVIDNEGMVIFHPETGTDHPRP